MPEPLVAVGIPTYNRALRLRRAAESVLNQTHRNLRLVISDDGSTDETPQVLSELTAVDHRVCVIRSGQNRGLSENFNVVYAALTGDYVMTLSDDDWIEPDYISQCLGALGDDVVLACGIARYLSDGEVVGTGRQTQLTADDPARRVRQYLSAVDQNGLLSGLMPRHVLNRATPMRNALGNDWLVVASILVQGKAVTVEETSLLREVGGSSGSTAKLVATLGLSRWQARVPHFVIAGQIAAEIGWRGPAFDMLTRSERYRLAAQSAAMSINWKSAIWHAIRGHRPTASRTTVQRS
jgi:glycosyltransferase involved in cell wall biosynthesis